MPPTADGTALDGVVDSAVGDAFDAIADSPTGDVDANAVDSGIADAAFDAFEGSDALDAGMGPECPPNDPAPTTVASTTTVSFVLTNTSSSDRWVLTQSTDCERFSIDGLVTALPPQSGCGTTSYPDEVVLFRTLAPGDSTTFDWDGRALVLYTTYQDCGPPFPACFATSNGAAQPVAASQYAAEFLVSSGLQTGSGTACTQAGPGGDVNCQLSSRGPGPFPQHGGQCTWSNASLLRQAFTLPASGTATVNVSIP
jgi:hypothetical protein